MTKTPNGLIMLSAKQSEQHMLVLAQARRVHPGTTMATPELLVNGRRQVDTRLVS